MRAEEWVKRGGSNGSLVCALCDVDPVSYRVTNFPTHVGRCEFGSGCYHCDLDFYTVEKGGRTISLCEFCYEGEWTRVGRRVFEVVRPSEFFLVDCAESLIWGHGLSGGAMLSQALGQGLRMVRQGLAWASSLSSGDFDLRGRILEKCFSFSSGFDVACCRRLREEGGLVERIEGSGGPCLV